MVKLMFGFGGVGMGFQGFRFTCEWPNPSGYVASSGDYVAVYVFRLLLPLNAKSVRESSDNKRIHISR